MNDSANSNNHRRRALLSVSRKEGLDAFARGLAERGFEIVASGGTARFLRKSGVAVLEVSEVTGHPEILDGRVKTLHPRIHGGILARRARPDDLASLRELGIEPIDVVAVNFYPFEETVARGAAEDEVRENIDIGGPCLVRAAAKNWPDVAVVVNPADYPEVLAALDDPEPGVGLALRRRLAAAAFAATAAYDRAVAASFVPEEAAHGFPERVSIEFERVAALRYGENPHQAAALYRDGGRSAGIPGARQLHGKELSYNNILDLDAAVRLVADLANSRAEDESAAAIIKHSNPAGAAVAPTLEEAYVMARATDPVSAFGGIVALSREVDLATAKEMASTFLEAIAAPSFHPDAFARLRRKKNLRLIEMRDLEGFAPAGRYFARVAGGLLVQDWDGGDDASAYRVATERRPSATEWEGLRFVWQAAKHVKSNAIVVGRGSALIGVGAGQMSRLDSCRLAVEKAQSSLEGAVAASDAFFPFADGLEALADAGITAVIQPGGSVRDQEVIDAANERGLAMVLTGARHFRH
jgi:phosphoribosylaminoimidazolecarboxamide formyltransferase/IMP cyclohydrolase